ncbi:uncharacterized protein LOC129600452 [Paramacrobiotus metropolitanus]|uniref:uncharacterized protein LOC129600452 n=1 Tax=Paramacrobiotus metropolitanus TaxID=2943436 RepID=UPI002445DCC5|nr:uncharacterized protein LOC129600452 [Paramacrobiotus metropolitanus]
MRDAVSTIGPIYRRICFDSPWKICRRYCCACCIQFATMGKCMSQGGWRTITASIYMDNIPDGRKAPSPESRRRARLSFDDDDEDDYDIQSARTGNRSAFNSDMQRPKMVYSRAEDEEAGFMETKPIIARTLARQSIDKHITEQEVEAIALDGLGGRDDEESRYHKDRPRAPRVPFRGSRVSTDDQHSEELRRHFQRRSSLRKAPEVAAGNLDMGTGLSSDRISSPNPPGTNEKIDAWLDEMKRNRPRSAAVTKIQYSNPMPDTETLMQGWPSGMEHMLRYPEQTISNLDCSLEEYIDIICALVGIPVYDGNRMESLHHLFSLYLDFKDIPRSM